jgi:hypothetical protein
MNTATIGTMTLLPPPEGLCQECATKHEPELPHNAQSLYYQTARHMQGLPANWLTAMEHCSEEMRAMWTDALVAAGVDVAGGKVNPEKRT